MQLCNILIADDELLARQAIKLALPVDDIICVVAECTDGADTITQIKKHLPDIIFLDIQMPGNNGIEVLESLPQDYDPYLIIVSAYDNYALSAYEHDAPDYFLKPFTQQRFDKVFAKAMKHWEANKPKVQTGAHRRRVIIKKGTKMIVVPGEEIAFIEANGDYTSVHTADRTHLHNESLNALEHALDPALFVRTHRSYIVNVKFIKELKSHSNGDYTVMLRSGQSLKLSRNYRNRLLQLMA
jgi:two-component system LytT family response regulator